MAVPDFQTIMLPMLRMMAYGREYSLAEMLDSLGIEFRLSEADLVERIPSGRQTRFYNRICWSTTHLKKAAIIENVARGSFRITDRGRTLLERGVTRIDLPLLNTFPEYVAFKNTRNAPEISVSSEIQSVVSPKTPDELLYDSYESIRESLAIEILESIKSCSPAFFELSSRVAR